MAALGDYHNFYMVTDVFLLGDVLENFRDMCLQYYGLDPSYNSTYSGLLCQAALKITAVKLDLLTDIDQHLFIEEGVRGQVAMISHRYTLAKALDMENYNISKRNSYIVYLDANNLYGWAMSQPLPTSNFKWLTDEKIKDLDEIMITNDSLREYISECDLGNYYFYYLYIYVYLIKCNVSFLYISEYPTINVTCCNMKDSVNLHPCLARIYAAKQTKSPLP